MSVIVGPSQRVCSRPTLVSTATGAASTFVASWRPPRPASTTATSTPRSASSENAAAVSSSNWVTRSPPDSVRSTLTAAAAARSTAAPKASGSRSASPMRMRSAKVERCGDRYAAGTDAVGLEDRRRHPHRRALAVGADHVDRAERALRAAERRQQAAHALEPEPHAEQLERERWSSRLARAVQLTRAPPARPAAARACRARPGPPAAAPWRRSPRWRACPRRARSRPRAACRSAAARFASASVSTASEASTATLPPGTGTVATRRRAVLGPLDAREPRDRVGGALVALGLQPRLQRAARARRRRGRATRAAPGPRRSRARARPRRPRRAARRRAPATGRPSAGPSVPGQVGPDLLGHERDHRVGERERLAQHVQRDRARPRRCRRRRAAA